MAMCVEFRRNEVSEVGDPDREEQVRADEAALEAWLRSRGGTPWFDGIVMECVERFPALDRFQVSAVIYKLGDEASALEEERASEESIRKFGFDFEKLSDCEIEAILRAAQESPEAVLAVCETLKEQAKEARAGSAIVEAAHPESVNLNGS
jgi:hypothetical protein